MGWSLEKKLAVRRLVQDTMAFGLAPQEAVLYVSKRLGSDISETTYYKYKRECGLTEDNAMERMNEHGRVGFVIKHFEIVDRVEALLRDAYNMVFITSDPGEKAGLIARIEGLERFLAELNIGSPMIAQMKAAIDQKTNVEQDINITIPADAHHEFTPSACVIPEGFIKSHINPTDDRRGMAAGTKPAHRIF